MYRVTTFFSGIFQKVRVVTAGATSPFQSLMYNIRSLRTSNPFAQLSRVSNGFGQRINYYLGQVGIKPKLPEGTWRDKLPERELELEREYERDTFKKRVRAPKRAHFSQIHLVQAESGERTVLHIGNASDVTLQSPSHGPVRLRFSQVDFEQYGARMMLTYLNGSEKLRVDGQPIELHAPIQDSSVITVRTQDYACALYAWDRIPVVTRVDAGWASSVGPVRENNEDAIGIYQHEKAYLFAIADGIGGGQDGDQLSQFAIQYLLAVFHKNVKYNLPWLETLQRAFENINAEVRTYVKRSPTPSGTTLTAVVIKDYMAYVAHVGDSRLYHLHGGSLRQLTADHVRVETVAQDTQQIKAGEKPLSRDLLEKAIGKTDRIQPDVFEFGLQTGDKLLLCTDGLSDMVGPGEMADMLYGMRASRLAAHLTQLANERKSTDNVSAIAVEVMPDPFMEDTWRARSRGRVFVGYSALWPMRLRKPPTGNTVSGEKSQRAGCLILAVLIFVVGLAWGTGQFQGRGTGENGVSAEVTAEITAETTVDVSAATATLVPTLTPRSTATELPSPTPSATATATLVPTAIPATSTLRVSGG
jgi:PPM family protein phosphatase